MLTRIKVRCATEKLFNQFMGRGKIACLYKGNYITEVHKIVEKHKKKDETAMYTIEEVEKDGKTRDLIIEIHGTDKTVKDTYRMSNREAKKFQTKVYLKANRTEMKVELIK